jgi:hypothetical protein
MRKSFKIICIAILAFCLWLLLHRPTTQKENSLEIQAPPTNQQLAKVANQSIVPETFVKSRSNNFENPLRRSPADMLNLKQRVLADWQTPIEFYGKVIDQNSNPVVGANIQFGWMETPAKDGERKASTKSDLDGLFSLQGEHGPSLNVSVNKDGYYTSRKDRTGYSYGDLSPGKFSPSVFDPVIFHLHKKGQGVDLATSEYGIRTDFPILVPRDGNPVNVDLLERKIDASGDLQISQIKPEIAHLPQATNWSFHMNLSDGGLIEENDDFPFTAPDTGYQPTVDLDFEKDSTNWATQFSKDYYIVFGQPQKYGLLHVDANIAQQTIFLKYAINPTGSRNLEPAN